MRVNERMKKLLSIVLTLCMVLSYIPAPAYAVATDFAVTIAEATNGKVEADKTTATEGDTITLTVTADEGYELDTLTVMNGETAVEVNDNSFIMPAGNVTISATFKEVASGIQAGYYLVGTLNGKNKLSVDQDSSDRLLKEDTNVEGQYCLEYTFAAGDKLKIAYFDGQEITKWYKDDDFYPISEAKAGKCILLFRPEGNEIWSSTYFTVTPAYSVTVNTVENGAVTADKAVATADETVTLKVTPAEGYEIDTVSYNDGADHTIAPVEGVYSFTMPAGDVTVTATFKIPVCTCTVKCGETVDTTCTVCSADPTACEVEEPPVAATDNIDAAEMTPEDLKAAVDAALAARYTAITVNLAEDADAAMFSAITAALAADYVADGTVDLTISGAKTVPEYGFFDNDNYLKNGEKNIAGDKLKSLTLTDVETIGEYAFSACTYLESVNLPQVVTIGDSAFNEWKKGTKLTSLNLPNATTIGEWAFAYSSLLTSVNLPKVTRIGALAFGYCDLRTLDLPEATTIDGEAFLNNYNLVSCSAPKATTIDYYPWGNCSKLETLELAAAGDFTLGNNLFANTPTGQINLVLHKDKESQVTQNDDGTAIWKCKVSNGGYNSNTFKSITTVHIPAADDGDCTTALICSACGETVVEAKESHTTELAENKATCQNKAKCDLCGTEYGEPTGDHSFDETGKCVCSAQAQTVITVGGETEYYLTLDDAISAVQFCTAEDNARVTLLTPVSSSADIGEGVFTLDLNGQTLTSSDDPDDDFVLRIFGGDVTLQDSAGGGGIVGTNEAENSDAVFVYDGKLTITSGTITGYTRGIKVSGGEVVLAGGIVKEERGSGPAAGIEMNGGSITVSAGSISGNVALQIDDGTVSITGGTITGRKFGICADRSYSGTVTITGGTIVKTGDSGYRGAVTCYGGEILITGGSISGETTDLISDPPNGKITLGLAEDGTGPVFPGGISLYYDEELNAYLDDGVVYWQNNKPIPVKAGQTELPGGDVTVGELNCDHQENTNTERTDNGNGTHSILCGVCGFATETAAHTFDTEGKCVCSAQAAAKIGTTFYGTLAEAAEKAAENDTIYILTDVETDEDIAFAAFVTLDVAEGKIITCTGDVTIGGSEGIIFENELYYYGGDVTNSGVNIPGGGKSFYFKAGEGYIIGTTASTNGPGTMKLVNATVNSPEDYGIIQSNLTLSFSGTNTITATNEDVNFGIYSYVTGDTVNGYVTLSGEEGAVLNIYAGDATSSSFGIYTKTVTITGGTVNIVSGNVPNGGTAGISANSVVVEEGATLNMTIGKALSAIGTYGSISGGGTVNGLIAVPADNAFGIAFAASGKTVLTADFTASFEGMLLPFSVPADTSLTVNEGVTLDLSGLTLNDIDFSGEIINHGTILLPEGFVMDNAPEDGTITVGDKSYTWDEENNKWICNNENSHTGGTATCNRGKICDLCGEIYGEADPNAHTMDESKGHTCMGYWCSVCESWYGPGNGDNHLQIGDCDCGLTTYPIWVMGCQVTSADLDFVGGLVNVSYDPGENILYLGRNIGDPDAEIVALKVDGDITVNVSGDKTVYGMIDVTGSLTITGEGSMTVDGHAYGIQAASVTFGDDVHVIAKGTQAVIAETVTGKGFVRTAEDTGFGLFADPGTAEYYEYQGAKQIVATVTIGDTTTYHLSLGDAITAVANCTEVDQAVVKLCEDVTGIREKTTITGGVFVLDLNGKVLSTSSRLILGSEAKLTLLDSTDGATGVLRAYAIETQSGSEMTLQSGTVEGTGYTPVISVNGTLTVSGGKVTSTLSTSYGINAGEGSTVTVTGGEISSLQGLYEVNGPLLSTIILSGGSFGRINTGANPPFASGADVDSVLKPGYKYVDASGADVSANVRELTNVTVVCAHSLSQHTTATDLGNGRHSFRCSVCNSDAVEDHKFDTSGKCVCGTYIITIGNVTAKNFDGTDRVWKSGDTIRVDVWDKDNGGYERTELTYDGTSWGSIITDTQNPVVFAVIGNGMNLDVNANKNSYFISVSDQQEQSPNVDDYDLMYAYKASINTDAQLDLHFEHLFTKITVNIEYGSEFTETPKVEYVLFISELLKPVVTITGINDGNLHFEYAEDWIHPSRFIDYGDEADMTDDTVEVIVGIGTLPAGYDFIHFYDRFGSTEPWKKVLVPEGGLTFVAGEAYEYNVLITSDGAKLLCAGEHSFTYTPNEDGTSHKKVCSDCGYAVTEEHTLLTYSASGNVITGSCSKCPAVGTATITAENTTYTGTAQETATVAYSAGWKGGELTVSYANNTNAGTATASITIGEATASVEFTIAKAEIDGSTLINPEFAEGLIYNGTAQALVTKTGSVDGGYIVYSLSIDGEYTTTIPVATEAGNYRVYWTIECDENHYVDGTPGSSRVTIAAKDASNATVTLDDTSVQFDGTAKTPGVTSVIVDGKTLNAETDYEVSYSNNIYVGTATVTITFKGNYTGNVIATFTIVRAAAPAIQWPTAGSLTYGQKLSESTLTSEDANGTFAWENGEQIPTVTNSGYVVVYTPKDTVNYDYSGVTLTQTIPVTVSKAPASVETAPAANTLIYTGEAQALVTAGAANNGEMQYSTDNQTWSTAIPKGTNAGEYTVYYKVVGDANHIDTDVQSVVVKIGQLAVAEPTVSGTYTYAGEEQTAQLTGVESYMTVASGNKATNAGSYEVVITLDGNHKWADGSDGKVQWSIGKAQAQISVNTDPITVTYGETVTLPTATTNFGVVVCDKTAADLVNAGTYTVTYTVAGTDNFEGDTKSITVTVNAKAITVTAEAKSKTYGDADPKLTYTVVGLENNDTLTGELKRAAGENVGAYAIEQGTLTAGNNYTITYTGAELTITAKAITKADVALDGSLTYTGEEQTQPITVTEGITYTVTGDKATDVGTYELTVKGTDNYTGEVKLSWSIKAAAATVDTAPKANNLTYTGEALALVTAGTTEDGKLVYSLSENGTYTETIPTGTNAGDYTVWYYVQGDANHADSAKASVKVTIAKAQAEITVDTTPITVTYGEAVTLPIATANFGEVDCDKTAAELVNAGTYTVTYTVDGTDNYEGDSKTVTVTIEKLAVAEPTVSGTYTYTGKEQMVTLTGVESYMTVASGDKATNAGSYEVEITLDGNHQWADGSDGKVQWSIGKAEFGDVYVSQSGMLTYNKAAQTPNVNTDADSVGNQTATFTYRLTENESYGEMPAFTDAGTYTVYFKASAPNHKDATGSFTVMVDKAKAEITVDTDPITVTYGDTVELPDATANFGTVSCDKTTAELVNVGTYTVTYTVAGTDNYDGDTKTVTVKINPKAITEDDVQLNGSLVYTGSEQTQQITVTAGIDFEVTGNKATNVGSYTLTVTASGNYTGSVTKDWSIKAAAAIVETAPKANNLTYTGEAQELVTAGTAKGGKLVYSLTEDGEYTETIPAGTNVGEYTVWYYVDGDYNHSDSAKASVKVTIAKAKAEISVDTTPITVTYGETVELPNATSSFGTVSRDKTAAELVNAGTYTVTYSVAGTDNYEGDTKTVTVTINAKAIVADDVKLIGSLTYNGKEQTQTITVTDGITYEISGNKATKAGKYELTVKGTGNYAGTITLDWEVAKATVTITADNKVIYIGEDIPVLTYKVSGLIGDDKLIKDPTLTTNADENQAGSYTITAANADAGDNYTITYVSGALTIMDQDTEVMTRIEITELTDVPNGLKDTEFDTVDKIIEELISRILATVTGYSAENMVHYDVTWQFSLDSGETWIRAMEEHFPTEGITVILPYPEGTNARDYDFAVSHMFSVTSQRLGITAGDVELPKVEETADGIRVTLNGLSPVTVAAKYHDHTGGTATCTGKAICTVCGTAYGELDATNHAGGTEIKNAKDATCGTEGYTGDTHCTGCGELVTKGTTIQATGEHTYGEWKVVKEATKTAKGEKQRTCSICGHVDSEEIPILSDIPATGDDSNIMLWGGTMVISLAALVVLLVESKKRRTAK